MPTPPTSIDRMQEVKELIEQALREGFRPFNQAGPGESAVQEAGRRAIAMGIVRTRDAFRSRFYRALETGNEPDWTLYVPARYSQPLPKQVIVPALPPDYTAVKPTGKTVRVLAIGDLHQDPRHPHRIDVLRKIGAYVKDTRPDYVVQIGDFGTFDSCSSHEKIGSAASFAHPSIPQDLDNMKEGLQAYLRAKGDAKPIQILTLGNHEHRIWRYQNANPHAGTTFSDQLLSMVNQFGWRAIPFGEVRYIEGVAFTHHPVNGAGKAFGGRMGITRASNEATVSMVSGHTHALKFWSSPKIGPTGGIDHMEIGCALPWGEIEHYATHGTTHWWHGIVELHICAGRITDFNAVSMVRLDEMYPG